MFFFSPNNKFSKVLQNFYSYATVLAPQNMCLTRSMKAFYIIFTINISDFMFISVILVRRINKLNEKKRKKLRQNVVVIVVRHSWTSAFKLLSKKVSVSSIL